MAGTIPPAPPDSKGRTYDPSYEATGPSGTVRPPPVSQRPPDRPPVTPRAWPNETPPSRSTTDPMPVVPPPSSRAPQTWVAATGRYPIPEYMHTPHAPSARIVPSHHPAPSSMQAPLSQEPASARPRMPASIRPVDGLPPTVVSTRGSYMIGRRVGTGHFGYVLECLGPFDQRYALKVLHPTGRPIEQVREEWTREVRRLLALRHPNVVYIHDAFEWQGTFCVALEWCDHSLTEMLEQPLREELAIELSRQMLAAVQYLHDQDLIHDDLHPGNVLVQQADRPIVKISDFGISTELRGAQSVRPEMVHHAIMAPELLALGYTSKQSDLYQLGMIMYWMITGEAPMQLHVPYPYLVQQINEGVARQRAETLDTPFGSIIAKLLRRRDAYRYGSAREVWADLRMLPSWRTRQLFPIR